ncbi:MAG: phosphate starvation-inducible protein PhoH [Candidatus Marinimicrobia bacterium]|nr:phosphate starvation-inducible protein PhoH [Candidatus Neomarinimicrobiota bacterium]
MEKIIELKSIELADILGIGDGHIKLIESNIPVSITARGDLLKIKGSSFDIDQANSILNEMRGTLSSKGALFSDDVNNLIKLFKSGEADLKKNLKDNGVIFYGRKGAIGPRTKGQSVYLDNVINNDIVFGIGPAGTGKTFLSMAFALSSLERDEVDRIILCRPAVEAGENLGFLPGDLKEKVDPYLSPLYDALDKMLPKNKLSVLIENKSIEIVPLAYMRGRTLDNAFMILDEAQNSTIMQMKMFLTRLGIGSKAIINGDVTQIDLDGNKHSGLIQAAKILKDVSGIEFTYFDDSDIVRHPLVKKIIGAYDTVDKEK